ncbi:MAG: patatin-like phospholipase family protein [Caldisericota bacterium]|nr:patatin-like phospholipase family protein [Caldisericota bacterium]
MRKIGLALGSGGPKGLSHIGVLKVLEKAGIQIDMIAGSSIGALVGSIYAVTESAKRIEEIAVGTNMNTVLSVLFDPTLKLGLVRGKKITKLFQEIIGDYKIESLPKKFIAVSTDLATGNPIFFEEGNLLDAVRASISIPFMFQPIRIENTLLADGGLSLQVPIEPLKKCGADIVIAVNLLENSFKPSKFTGKFINTPRELYEVASNSINILQYNIARENCKKADIIVAPDVKNIKWDSFWKPQKAIRRGEKAMKEKLPDLLKILKE